MEQRPLFHEQLRFEREWRGWSQADLAEKIGCDTKKGNFNCVFWLAGNILNLLSFAGCSLRGFDFSHLTVRQAYLLNVPLPDVNFARAHFVATVFTSTFGNVYAIACSPQKNRVCQVFCVSRFHDWGTLPANSMAKQLRAGFQL